MSSPWAPGARFGKYKLVERLGRGGMAETWRGELLAAEGVRRAVVIKRVLPSFSDNREFVEAFVQEARLTASLSHGNVAQVFDFGQVGDSHFIAMELIDGRSLDRVLKHSIQRGYWHLPYPIATLIALEVAKGLEHVHTRRGPKGPLNIVHRDVSPDNIIVGMNGETKVVDFGVAKSVLTGRPETEAGVIKGKYIYFSPEQAAGEKVDFRTDIYALGVVLYRLVTGKKAFDGPGLKVLGQIQRAEYQPLRVANPDVPDQLATVIETMMAPRKHDRFASTLELVEALSSTLVHMAPRAGVHWIRDYVRWLYSEDLERRGEAPELRSGFLDLLEQWRPHKKPSPTQEGESAESRPDQMATIASRPHGHQRRATHESVEAAAEPWSTRKKLYAAGAGAGAAALVALFVALTTTRDAHEGESDEARNRRIAEETRMKPIEGLKVKPTAPDDEQGGARGPSTKPPEPATPSDVPPATAQVPPEPPPRPRDEVAYDVELAPVTFTLTREHQVSLDPTPTLPGASGTLTGARPASGGGDEGFKVNWMGRHPGVHPKGPAAAHDVPVLMFTPGRSPKLEVLADAAKWTREDTKLAMLVGSASESPAVAPTVTVNGRPVFESGAILVVEESDRFTVRDLEGKSWKLTVTPMPAAGESIGPVLFFGRGEELKVNGRTPVGGYAVLQAGTHRVSGATSAWLTVPTLPSLKLASIEVSIQK